MRVFTYLLILVMVFAINLWQIHTPSPASPVEIQRSQPVDDPNSDCYSGAEQWDEFEVSCNDRQEKFI